MRHKGPSLMLDHKWVKIGKHEQTVINIGNQVERVFSASIVITNPIGLGSIFLYRLESKTITRNRGRNSLELELDLDKQTAWNCN